MLTQPDDAGHQHPVAYESRRLTAAGRRLRSYPAHVVELRAVVHALPAFRHNLLGGGAPGPEGCCSDFDSRTDKQAIAWLETNRHPNKVHARSFDAIGPRLGSARQGNGHPTAASDLVADGQGRPSESGSPGLFSGHLGSLHPGHQCLGSLSPESVRASSLSPVAGRVSPDRGLSVTVSPALRLATGKLSRVAELEIGQGLRLVSGPSHRQWLGSPWYRVAACQWVEPGPLLRVESPVSAGARDLSRVRVARVRPSAGLALSHKRVTSHGCRCRGPAEFVAPDGFQVCLGSPKSARLGLQVPYQRGPPCQCLESPKSALALSRFRVTVNLNTVSRPSHWQPGPGPQACPAGGSAPTQTHRRPTRSDPSSMTTLSRVAWVTTGLVTVGPSNGRLSPSRPGPCIVSTEIVLESARRVGPGSVPVRLTQPWPGPSSSVSARSAMSRRSPASELARLAVLPRVRVARFSPPAGRLASRLVCAGPWGKDGFRAVQ